MTEPIGPIFQPSPSLQGGSNAPALSRQMKEQVLMVADHLQKLKDDQSLASDPTFLSEFASNASKLNQTVVTCLEKI
jgi:hypothetical protein